MHFTDEEIEQYLLGHIADESEIEEHLLACSRCLEHCEQVGVEIAIVREALRRSSQAAHLPIMRLARGMTA